MAVHISSKAEWDEVMKKDLVVVDFHAQWCGPCKMIAPFYEELAKSNPNVTFIKVDVDEVPAVAEVCGISAMPTFQFFKNGVKVEELMGASKDKLQEKLNKLISA